MDIEAALTEIKEEMTIAMERFDPFNTFHEGYAVILEELDELWDEIKGNQNRGKLTQEAIQVGAMALRFLVDLIGEE